MTETVGYYCPRCLSWWTRYLNKDGKLYCECDVPEEEWFYIYRKTYGNRIFGIAEKRAIVSYRDMKLVIHESDVEDLMPYPHLNKAKLKSMVKNLLNERYPALIDKWQLFYIAFKKAFSQSSSNQWFERCPKCKHYRKGNKCNKGHTWFTVDCQDFDLKDSIKKFIKEGSGNR